MNERVELRTVLAAIRARLLIAALVVALAMAAGYVASRMMPKVYAATTSVLVGETTQSTVVARDDILASKELTATYVDLARREPVLGPVVTALGLDSTWSELRERVLVTDGSDNKQLIVVTVQAASPEEATNIAKGIADQLIQLAPSRADDPNVAFLETQVQRLQEEIPRRQTELADVIARQAAPSSAQEAQALQIRADTLTRQISDLQSNYANLRDLMPSGGDPNSLAVLEPASAAPGPIRPDLRMNLLISAVLGLLLAAGLCYYLEFHERRPRNDRRPHQGPVSPYVTQAGSRPEPRPGRPSDSEPLAGAGARPLGNGTTIERPSAGAQAKDR